MGDGGKENMSSDAVRTINFDLACSSHNRKNVTIAVT